MRAISLFSGAGGLDLGLEAAGWTTLAQIESNTDCAQTLESHNESKAEPARVIARPIENVRPAALRKELGLSRGELDLLAGGPPCQPFTTSGLRRGLTDARAVSLFPAYINYVKEFSPKALLIENVDGILSAALRHRPLSRRGREHAPLSLDERKGSFLRWLVHELVALGYSMSWGVVEVADHGVPQLRQRAIAIGVRSPDPCFLPDPNHGRDGLPPYRTLRQAIEGLTELGPVQPLSDRKRAVYVHVPAGGNWRALPDEMRRATMGAAYHAEGGKGGWWRRLSWDAPSPTILGMPDHSSTALIHPDELRCLSVNECALLQSFERSARFAGTPRSQYQQIGNAVPPVLAERLGRHLAEFLGGARQPLPSDPPWRRISANRRIGTHGWARGHGKRVAVALTAAVRPDHVWHFVQDDADGTGPCDRIRNQAA